MKKIFVACAIVMAAMTLTSCGDTEKCYIVTTEVAGATTQVYWWGTKNNLDVYVDNAKKAAELLGGKVSYRPAVKAQSDCTGVAVDVD